MDKALSSNLAFIKGKSSRYKFSCFTSRNNNSKGSENSEYSIDLGITENECTVTYSFHFAEEICKRDPNVYMASLDVDSLVTNILLDGTIDICICIDSLLKDYENTPKIPKVVFRNCLTWWPKNRFLCLTANSINNLMEWLWDLH